MIDIDRRTQRNGLRVSAVPIAGLRSVSVLLAMEAGQYFEPPGRPGVARLTAQAMLRGTARRDAVAWSDALDALGASARLDVGLHAAVFSGQCLSDDLDAFLDLVAETVLGDLGGLLSVDLRAMVRKNWSLKKKVLLPVGDPGDAHVEAPF